MAGVVSYDIDQKSQREEHCGRRFLDALSVRMKTYFLLARRGEVVLTFVAKLAPAMTGG